MTELVLIVGWSVIAISCAGLVAWLALWVWFVFPARFVFARDTPSHIDTPFGLLRITLFTGVTGRTQSRWFFGFMLMKDGEAPRAKVMARKTTGNK
jgi:hypothetical protein